MTTQFIYEMAQTWNAGASTFDAIKMNVNATAHTANSLLLNLQTNSTTRFAIRAPHIENGSDTTPFLKMADVWNTNGTAIGLQYDVTDTASLANSKLLDLKVGGASMIGVRKDGVFIVGVVDGPLFFHQTAETSVYISNFDVNIGAGNGRFEWLFPSSIGVANSGAIGWVDVRLWRDNGDTLALRRGVNTQTLRGYRTFTDSSNYERWALQSGSGYFELAAETAGTGTDDIDIRFTPAGTGVVQFGSHTANATVTISGFITIKDAAGNSRKLAVVS